MFDCFSACQPQMESRRQRFIPSLRLSERSMPQEATWFREGLAIPFCAVAEQWFLAAIKCSLSQRRPVAMYARLYLFHYLQTNNLRLLQWMMLFMNCPLISCKEARASTTSINAKQLRIIHESPSQTSPCLL